MNSDIQISCILPNYNDGRVIGRAIEAFKGQGIPYEIVVVDDKSTDNSLQILSKLAQSDPRIRIYQNDMNMGSLASAIKGLQHTRGEYFYFGSANDRILPGFFQRAISALNQYRQASFFCANAYIIKHGEKIKSNLGWGEKERYFSIQDVSQKTFGRARSFHGQSVVMRRSIFLDKELIENTAHYRKLGGMMDLFMFAACALRHGFYYSPEAFSEIEFDERSFSAQLKNSAEKAKAIRATFEIMNQPFYDDVREKIIQSGILSYIGLRLFLIIAKDRRWDLLSMNLVRDFFYLCSDKIRRWMRIIK